MRTLKTKQLAFEAGQYVSSHPTCGFLHGHTYLIKNLEIEVDDNAFLDFGFIKEVIKEEFDHLLFVPIKHEKFWHEVAEKAMKELGDELKFKLQVIVGEVTVENLSDRLKTSLSCLRGVKSVHFELYEGLNQGVKV